MLKGSKQGHVLLLDSDQLKEIPPDFSKSSSVMLRGSILTLFVTLFKVFKREITFFSNLGLLKGVFPADLQSRSGPGFSEPKFFFEDPLLVLISVVKREDKEFRGAQGGQGEDVQPDQHQP